MIHGAAAGGLRDGAAKWVTLAGPRANVVIIVVAHDHANRLLTNGVHGPEPNTTNERTSRRPNGWSLACACIGPAHSPPMRHPGPQAAERLPRIRRDDRLRLGDALALLEVVADDRLHRQALRAVGP
jgi:hypothetical protein